jgi:predicted regulator of Ras-like GTPase activity (Roadblock/LC7/MglB family)
MHTERRVHRSDDLLEALALQLAATAARAACSAIVLTQRDGLPLAEAGDDAAAEEIAAIAPTLVRDGRRWHGAIPTSLGDRLVTISPLPSAQGTMLLCAVGGLLTVLGPELALGGRGVARILA